MVNVPLGVTEVLTVFPKVMLYGPPAILADVFNVTITSCEVPEVTVNEGTPARLTPAGELLPKVIFPETLFPLPAPVTRTVNWNWLPATFAAGVEVTDMD